MSNAVKACSRDSTTASETLRSDPGGGWAWIGCFSNPTSTHAIPRLPGHWLPCKPPSTHLLLESPSLINAVINLVRVAAPYVPQRVTVKTSPCSRAFRIAIAAIQPIFHVRQRRNVVQRKWHLPSSPSTLGLASNWGGYRQQNIPLLLQNVDLLLHTHRNLDLGINLSWTHSGLSFQLLQTAFTLRNFLQTKFLLCGGPCNDFFQAGCPLPNTFEETLARVDPLVQWFDVGSRSLRVSIVENQWYLSSITVSSNRQTRVGLAKTDFARTKFDLCLCVFVCVLVSRFPCGCWFQGFGLVMFGAPEPPFRDRPSRDHSSWDHLSPGPPKFRSFFFSLSHHDFHSFFSLSWGPFVEIWGCSKRRAPKCAHLGSRAVV